MKSRNMRKQEELNERESLYVASQWQLMWRKFKRHKLAIFAGIVLGMFYTVAIFAEFFSPYDIYEWNRRYVNCPPQRIRFFDQEGRFHLRPFIHGLKPTRDPVNFNRIYTTDKTKEYPLHFFVHAHEYKLWNLFSSDVHFFGVKEGTMFLFGTGQLGRDLFSRTLYASRISLSIGLIGVALSFILGCILGGVSGYYGGTFDMVIQRIIEFLLALPKIPLWMSLTAALPLDWSPIKVYFGIIVILSIFGWCSLARVVRGKFLQLREEDFVMAARISGATSATVIRKHLLPSFMSYLVVHLTLAVPAIILAETALSFLGLGLRAPVVSWGTLLKNAQSTQAIVFYPWILIPSLFVVTSVLAFNFLGDGIRDAADPYK